MTTPARKPRTPAKVIPIRKAAIKAAVKPEAELPATRPVVDKAAEYRVATELTYRASIDEIAMLDANDARSEAAHQAKLAQFETERDEAIKLAEKNYANNVHVANGARDAERAGTAQLRAEHVEIAARSRAALALEDEAIASFRLSDGEGQA